MNDIDIAHGVQLRSIFDVSDGIGIDRANVINYGAYKAKVRYDSKVPNNGNLILVTAINPTPLGEGKTTVSIGIADALRKLGKKSILSLREPSLGPVFGMKGGATGGGFSQIVPMEDINLHFTGDFAAIEACNNLLCAAVDNHIYQGNELRIKDVLVTRCLDVNDRSLRSISYGDVDSSFVITAASEIMALFCLANSFEDLRARLGNIVVGIDYDNNYVFARQLGIVGSLLALLKDAFNPNLVQTLEGTPCFVHGGPFANIAHGCSSVVSLKTALNYGEYVITEAGFGADLGAEKFFDITCRSSGLNPSAVVIVATIRALKYNGGVSKEHVLLRNAEALQKGFDILEVHIDNIKRFNSNIIVCLNKFDSDYEDEVVIVEELCKSIGADFALSTAYMDGGIGAIDVAKKIINLDNSSKLSLLYNNDMSIIDKINSICVNVYRADSVNYSDIAIERISELEKNNFSNLPICVAKTQYSLSDNSNNVGITTGFSVTVSDVKLYNGAGFITVYLGNILTMPGLPKEANYLNIDIVDDEIVGIK
ncbi:MAG: formate--tetrahydrofolate ligase [Bacilli bacterium]|nr:formate--tetrahydrofolate ligase [Bacilli bacterium]